MRKSVFVKSSNFSTKQQKMSKLINTDVKNVSLNMVFWLNSFDKLEMYTDTWKNLELVMLREIFPI